MKPSEESCVFTRWMEAMNNSSSRSYLIGSSAASLVWLISFGDLLTLLVCFFLVLTPWSNVTVSSSLQEQLLKPILSSERGHGTSLANRPLGSCVSSDQLGEFVLMRSAFSEGQEARLQDVIESASREAMKAQSSAARVILQICGTHPRAEALRRVGGGLMERLGERLSLAVEIDGECQLIQARHPRVENPVGVIRIIHQ